MPTGSFVMDENRPAEIDARTKVWRLIARTARQRSLKGGGVRVTVMLESIGASTGISKFTWP